ncbi:helix-turn-helix domain-containing protein [Reyranella sp.]|uniref:helix-turn-helix domain-containing protein n=1 Tax=Reyranella sp. TaxID=1929291 RepID=UPI00403595FE
MHTNSAISARIPAAVALRGAANMQPAGIPTAGLPRILVKGEELFAEGDSADYFYKVVSGSIRTCKLLSDGRRQIDAFHLAGDIFGLEAGAEYRFTAEALGDATLVAFRRSRLAELTAADPAFANQVLASMMKCLGRAQDHMLLLGRKTAQEKIATFLLDMAKRISSDDEHLELPMQRSDIADHLGLTIETVSRTLTQFARQGLIRLQAGSRSVDLCNLAALRKLDA